MHDVVAYGNSCLFLMFKTYEKPINTKVDVGGCHRSRPLDISTHRQDGIRTSRPDSAHSDTLTGRLFLVTTSSYTI